MAQIVHIAVDVRHLGTTPVRRDGSWPTAAVHLQNQLATDPNYGEYLERHPPTHEVQIVERSSWSWLHGVGRWLQRLRRNTGQTVIGTIVGAPVEGSTRLARATAASEFEAEIRDMVGDPVAGAAREEYIEVSLTGLQTPLCLVDAQVSRPPGQLGATQIAQAAGA